MTATTNVGKSIESVIVKPPPVHPTYDLKGVIKLALSEDAGDKGFTFFVLFFLKLLICFKTEQGYQYGQSFLYPGDRETALIETLAKYV